MHLLIVNSGEMTEKQGREIDGEWRASNVPGQMQIGDVALNGRRLNPLATKALPKESSKMLCPINALFFHGEVMKCAPILHIKFSLLVTEYYSASKNKLCNVFCGSGERLSLMMS